MDAYKTCAVQPRDCEEIGGICEDDYDVSPGATLREITSLPLLPTLALRVLARGAPLISTPLTRFEWWAYLHLILRLLLNNLCPCSCNYCSGPNWWRSRRYLSRRRSFHCARFLVQRTRYDAPWDPVCRYGSAIARVCSEVRTLLHCSVVQDWNMQLINSSYQRITRVVAYRITVS